VYRVEYLPSAISDILEAENYLNEFNSTAATKFSKAVVKQTDALTKHPLMHRVYKFANYLRCMPLPYKYLLFYQVDESAQVLRIHRILHGMRDIPTLL
jgi:addiction module RelE/StbE family toxin